MRLKFWGWYAKKRCESGELLPVDVRILKYILFPFYSFIAHKMDNQQIYDPSHDTYFICGERYSADYFRLMHNVKDLPIRCIIFRKNGIIHMQETDYDSEYNINFNIEKRSIKPPNVIKRIFLWLVGRPYYKLKSKYTDEMMVQLQNRYAERLDEELIYVLSEEKCQ